MSNKYITPLEGNYISKIEGIIKVKYKDEVKFNVCKITYELYEGGNYQYIFEPYYDVLDALKASIFQGIPGLNLEKRKKFYYRVNYTPSFISERTMGEDRENIEEELEKVCMKEYNPLEWLIRTDSEYSGDNLIVERYRLPKYLSSINYNDLMYGDVVNNLDGLEKDVELRAYQLLSLIGSGVIIDDENLTINSQNRVGALQLLINQYIVASTYTNNKKEQKVEVKEKRKSNIDDFVLEEVMKELELKIINEIEAMNMLNITSKATLNKKIREYKAKKK